MSIEAFLARGRAAAVELMVDACTIEYLDTSVTDQDLGTVDETFTPVYAGKCRFQQPAPSGNRTDVGEADVLVGQLILQVPMSVVGIRPNAVVTCTASALDPDLVGRKWTVTGLGHKTHSTMRRVALQEVND